MTIYETVTQRILSQLEAGVVPWHKPWSAWMPKSLRTGKDYRGVNVLLLGTTAFTSRYWITYREALRQGGHVRKGEHATPVVFWKWRTYEELVELSHQGHKGLSYCVPFISSVFNLDQVDGVTRPADDVLPDHDRRLEIAEGVVDAMPDKPEIVHQHLETPSYGPLVDRVTMPHLSQFNNAEDYYVTLFHELTHASGHPKRLNRFRRAHIDQMQGYSFEELVAEFGAAFLCAFTGINHPAQDGQHASYIEGWAKVFRGDSRIILRAAGAAQRAVDYIRGKVAMEDAARDDQTQDLEVGHV